MSEQYLSVGQVNNYIKNIFDAEFMLQNICVYGEISSYKISNNIAYFNLADETGILPCVLFNASRFNVPNIGDTVLVVGSVSYYVKGGKLSFNANHIAPYGKGLLYENFLKLKNELEQKGYFASEHKKSLPERVSRIGVVSSSTGAVIQDIINVTTRRNPTVDIVLFPVKVQGVGAEEEIAKGINFFSEYEDIDVVIVARGGGSAEDLQPFNTEIVATATYNCKKPIVSAVGHETDFTIIDFVADLRAPTPSAAAECVVNDIDNDYAIIDNLYNYCYDNIIDKILELTDNNKKLLEKIYYISSNIIEKNNNLIDRLSTKINHNIDVVVTKYQNQLDILKNRLDGLNPEIPLEKGYVRVENNCTTIKSSNDISSGKQYNLIFADGTAKVRGE